MAEREIDDEGEEGDEEDNDPDFPPTAPRHINIRQVPRARLLQLVDELYDYTAAIDAWYRRRIEEIIHSQNANDRATIEAQQRQVNALMDTVKTLSENPPTPPYPSLEELIRREIANVFAKWIASP